MGNMELLDRSDYLKLDNFHMLDAIANFPQMCRDAFEINSGMVLPSYYIKPKKVVLLGMGGSGAACDIVRDYLAEHTDLVIESVHNYDLPGFVDKDTLVIANSFSGNTEETLSGFISAYERGAKLIAITKGGKLKVLANKYRVPSFIFQCDSQPRGAFPYLFILLLGIFQKLGHLEVSNSAMENCLGILDAAIAKYGPESSLFGNPAKIMAEKLHGKIPVVLATEKLAGVASRWKNQFNENSKNLSFTDFFPELNHNLILGAINPKNMCYILSLESNLNEIEAY
jgi:glucose/mannose-6-phosphate isomerase